MSHIYQYYRQIKISNHDGRRQPQVSGIEEIWSNDKKQVHYLNENEVYSVLQELTFPFNFLAEGLTPFSAEISSDWMERDFSSTQPRYLNPNQVIIRDLNSPSRKTATLTNQLSRMGKFVQEKLHQFNQRVKRLPDALRAAWETLNRPL